MATENKTKPTKVSPNTFLKRFSLELQKDAKTLIKIFEKVSKEPTVMWGEIFGYGTYHYKSPATGREGDFLATGFALRKTAITIYIISGAEKYPSILKDLGKFKTSKGSCIYIKNLEDINLKVLEKLIKQGLIDLKKK